MKHTDKYLGRGKGCVTASDSERFDSMANRVGRPVGSKNTDGDKVKVGRHWYPRSVVESWKPLIVINRTLENIKT